MFQRARFKAVIPANIRAGFKGADLMPNNPFKVFKRISINTSFFSRFIYTSPDQIALQNILLKNSPPEDIEIY